MKFKQKKKEKLPEMKELTTKRTQKFIYHKLKLQFIM